MDSNKVAAVLREALAEVMSVKISTQPEWAQYDSNPEIWTAYLARVCGNAIAATARAASCNAGVNCTEPNRADCPRHCMDFCNKAEEAKFATDPRPCHETIVREGDQYTCTVCGTSAPVGSADLAPDLGARDAATELEIQRGFNDGLTLAKRFSDNRDAALEEVIKYHEELARNTSGSRVCYVHHDSIKYLRALKSKSAPVAAPVEAVTDAEIDIHLDAVLSASGSALKYFSMPKTIEAMREAMRTAILAKSKGRAS